MFCRNCGKELSGTPQVCIGCGARPHSGSAYCAGCSAPTTPLTEICVKCGARATAKAASTGGDWMPVVAGVLGLIISIPGLIIGVAFAAFGWLAFWVAGWLSLLLGGPMIVLGIIGIVGSICALRRRGWGIALAGAICALVIALPPVIPAIFLGIPAVVLIVLGKDRFE